MASENNKLDGHTVEATAQGESQTQPKIVCDHANIQPVYADATNVTGGRDEIAILFGKNQSLQPGEKQINIQISDRIVLSPLVAKRLSILLSDVIQDYERAFGNLPIESDH